MTLESILTSRSRCLRWRRRPLRPRFKSHCRTSLRASNRWNLSWWARQFERRTEKKEEQTKNKREVRINEWKIQLSRLLKRRDAENSQSFTVSWVFTTRFTQTIQTIKGSAGTCRRTDGEPQVDVDQWGVTPMVHVKSVFLRKMDQIAEFIRKCMRNPINVLTSEMNWNEVWYLLFFFFVFCLCFTCFTLREITILFAVWGRASKDWLDGNAGAMKSHRVTPNQAISSNDFFFSL